MPFEEKETTKAKTEKNIFGDWIRTIPEDHYDKIRHQVIAECKITDQIFRHWKCGNSKVPVLAQEKINQIAGYEVFKTESK